MPDDRPPLSRPRRERRIPYPFGATVALLAVVAAIALVALLGAWPIYRDCGRLPMGQGETMNRVLGLWERC